MTESNGLPTCPMTRKLIALLDENAQHCPAERRTTFADRLASLETEAMASAAAPTTLTLIRIAKETTALADRLAIRSRTPLSIPPGGA